MNERRRFLHVLGASVATIGVGPLAAGCGGAATDSGPGLGATSSTSAGGAGGASGAGGAGPGGGGPGGQGQGGLGQGGQGQGGQAQGGQGQGGGGPSCTQTPTGVEVGVPADFAQHGLHKAPAAKALIGRDANGLYALSAACTHAGCNMAGSSGKIVSNGADVICTCHGSEFDADGQVVQGPAWKPQPHVSIELGCDGKLYVDRKKTVSSSFRLVV
jgi:Rieske Fe-S protein